MLMHPHFHGSAHQAIRAAMPLPLLEAMLPQIVRAAHGSSVPPPLPGDHLRVELEGEHFWQSSGDFSAGDRPPMA
jgi:hypothetical protein